MKRAPTLVFCLLVTGWLGAQSLPSVDIDTANMQIEQFEYENGLLEERIELMRSSIDRLESDIETWKQWSNGIERVLRMLDDRAGQLLDVLAEIGSRSIVARAESVLDRYTEIRQLLDEKTDELAGRVDDAERIIRSNRATVGVYESRIEQNSRNIELLKAAIASSVDSESSIESDLEALDSLLDDAAELLMEPRSREETSE